MTELHPSNGQQITAKPRSNTRRVTQGAERRSIEPTSEGAPLLNRSIPRNWQMFLIWSFVVFSFAAFFFCFWVIAAKCRGD